MIFEIKSKDAWELVLATLNSGDVVDAVFAHWTNSGTAMYVRQDGAQLPITIQFKNDGTWYAMYDSEKAK